jgi:hypothetical protein
MNENETREEEEEAERRRVVGEGGSTYAHRTAMMKRIFFFSLSFSL